jgi:hypothetical protein
MTSRAASATAAATVVVATGAPTVTLSGGAVFGRALPASGGVPVNEFSQTKITATETELKEERAAVKELGLI